MAEIEALGVEVGNVSAKIDAYEQCRTSDDQLEQLDNLETQLETLTTYLNNSNVQAWTQVISETGLGSAGCQYVPMEWCNNVLYVDGGIQTCAYNDDTNKCESQ